MICDGHSLRHIILIILIFLAYFFGTNPRAKPRPSLAWCARPRLAQCRSAGDAVSLGPRIRRVGLDTVSLR